ncbi:MAG: methyltransferase domain-containing protein [Microthrixaceae bacterium]
MNDAWEPDRYHQFRAERTTPFRDLLALARPFEGDPRSGRPRLLDLGCGSGELTVEAHRLLGSGSTLGVDTSASMLAGVSQLDEPGVRFEQGDLASITGLDRELPVAEVDDQRMFGAPGWDLILANASLHWVPDHASVLAHWRAQLRPGGQLAVQVPANPDHPSHTTITEVLGEEPFRSALGGAVPPDPLESVLSPERYAEVLWEFGAQEQVVRLGVYGMEMAHWSDVVEWTSGTALVRVRNALTPELYEQAFLPRYRERLGEHLDHRSPYFYAFKRILMWARFP